MTGTINTPKLLLFKIYYKYLYSKYTTNISVVSFIGPATATPPYAPPSLSLLITYYIPSHTLTYYILSIIIYYTLLLNTYYLMLISIIYYILLLNTYYLLYLLSYSHTKSYLLFISIVIHIVIHIAILPFVYTLCLYLLFIPFVYLSLL